MKLIIDIPGSVYNAIKEWNKQGVATLGETIIANGKAYEERPQGKLISRTWLKEHKFTT